MGRPRRPWIKLLVDVDKSDKIGALSCDASRWGWIRVLVAAKTQRKMGVFGSRRHLKNVIGQHGRYVGEYIGARLAHEAPLACADCRREYRDAEPGEVVVHDYRREQRDPTHNERQAAYDAAETAVSDAIPDAKRRRVSDAIPANNLTADSRARGTTVTVTGISSGESRRARQPNGRPDEPPDVQALLDRGWRSVSSGQRDMLFELADRHDRRGQEGQWAAGLIRATPLDEDPLEALRAADCDWKARRRAEVDREELEWKATKEAERRALEQRLQTA